MIFNFVLGPGGRGGVRTAIFLRNILGFGPIPAQILKFLIFILALSTARIRIRPKSRPAAPFSGPEAILCNRLEANSKANRDHDRDDDDAPTL